MQPHLRLTRLLSLGVLLFALAGCGKKPSANRSDATSSSSRRQPAPRPATPPAAEASRTLGGIELGPLVEAGPNAESIIESALVLTDNREKGVQGLITAGPAARSVVLALLTSKSLDEVHGALDVLEAEGDPTGSRTGAAEPLIALLTHEVSTVRDRVWALAPDVVDGEGLLKLVKQVSAELRPSVIRLLELWDSQEIRAELALLALSPDLEMAREAAFALATPARPPSPEASRLVADLLETPSRRALALAVAARLGETLAPELRATISRTIEESLTSQDLELVLAATRATPLLSVDDRMPLLEQLSRDVREDVRRVAAEALGTADLSGRSLGRANEVLDLLLTDAEGAVRIAAIRSRGLTSQGAAEASAATRAIAQKLQDGHRGVRLAAAVVLAQPAFAKESVALLEAQLGREDAPGRGIILEAMAASGSRPLVAVVVTKLSDDQLMPAAHHALMAAAALAEPPADWERWLDETLPATPEAQ